MPMPWRSCTTRARPPALCEWPLPMSASKWSCDFRLSGSASAWPSVKHTAWSPFAVTRIRPFVKSASLPPLTTTRRPADSKIAVPANCTC